MSIHVFQTAVYEFSVWTDCEPNEEHSGRCLCSAQTKREALHTAIAELENDIKEARVMLAEITPVPT